MKNKSVKLHEMMIPLEIKERSLNDIIADVYCEDKNKKRSDLNTSLDNKYKNYNKEQTTKISSIAKNLDRNINDFKTEMDRYKIPFNVSEIIAQYMLENSENGSFISKIRNNKLNQVTNKEKLEFINRPFDRVFKSCRDDEDKDYNETLRREYIEMIDVLSIADKKHKKLIEISNNTINKNIKTIYNIKETDGFVKFGIEDGDKKIIRSKYENSISLKDAEMLTDAYSLMIEALNNKWEKIVDEYINQKNNYFSLSTFEDAEKLIDVELCMLKDALDVTYMEKESLKEKITKEQLDKIEEFLKKETTFQDNKVIKILTDIN